MLKVRSKEGKSPIEEVGAKLKALKTIMGKKHMEEHQTPPLCILGAARVLLDFENFEQWKCINEVYGCTFTKNKSNKRQ